MLKSKDIINIIIGHAIQHAHNCIKNTRELNRTVSMGESKRHISKYAQLLTENKISLMEDLELLARINNHCSMFNSSKLLELRHDFENTDMHLSMYQQMIKILRYEILKK